ncbi:MAG: hypothetical protein COS85_15605 [Armatimonadetes bacterium CG07_land_8_20_14_0_80_59_28]|nr:MAG: hypothetical protein COS85_15605 [Armatimonadetes bacterium CG07_land_8_20_14_0_80_59_28]
MHHSADAGGHRIILDAGTGLRLFGNSVHATPPLLFHLCLSHFHWDHIQGIPFFKHLYVPNNEIIIYGPADSDEAIYERMQGQMGSDYFPISIDALQSSVRYVAIGEKSFDILNARVSTLRANHPGPTVLYRVDVGDKSVVFAPDNEIPPPSTDPELADVARRVADFAQGADLLIHDCMYSAASYESHRGWGHTAGAALAAVAAEAQVQRVLLFHHSPDDDDGAVEAIHDEFRTALRDDTIGSEPAREGVCYAL